MKFKWSKGKIFVLAILALVTIHWLFFRALSEAQMIAKFHAHKAEFEQLRLMVADKNVQVIAKNWTEAKHKNIPLGVEVKGSTKLPLNISKDRLLLYRKRMNDLGIIKVVGYDQSRQIRFSLFGGGWTDTTWGIGYAWCKDTPKPLVKSAYNQMPGRDKIHFSRIEGDWYLYQYR